MEPTTQKSSTDSGTPSTPLRGVSSGPVNIAATYAIVAASWIWLSDLIIVRFELSPRLSFLFGAIKGTLFIVVTSAALYVLVRRLVVQIERDAEANRSLELQFQQSQRMEALGKLAANIVHDSKNHLMVISGNTELLNLIRKGNLKRRDAILEAVQKCDKLNRDLLAFSRKQDASPNPERISTVIDEFSRMLRTAIGAANVLSTSLESEWKVMIDRAQFEQVFLNLALNAKDAMPNGGTFSIRASDVDIPSRSPDADASKEEYVQVVVSDTGVGIPEDKISHVFEPFFTTKERSKGSGLGLSAVQGIITQNGGRISVRSKPGDGTTFEILLPRILA